jgi:glycosyltransferase involved in cell wall biosynthesis
MLDMKVTVGIPTYNRSEMLKQAIESVLAQSFTDFRLLVSDNASEDDTAAVVRSFGDERIDYQRSARNIGAAANFRRLLDLADSDYLLILPDDDSLYPGYLQAAVDVLERFDNVGLAHCAFDLIDDGSRVVRRMHPVATHAEVAVERGDEALERLMVSNWPLNFSSVLYRTEAILAAGGIRAEEEPFGDLQLWMRMALQWDFGYIAEPLAAFRVHAESTSANIAAAAGAVSDDERALLRAHAQTRFERRMNFLDNAPLEKRREEHLRGVATLEHLIERAALGLGTREVAAGLARIAQNYPRLLKHRAFWRLVVAQLGGRRLRAALRRRAGRS